MTVSNMRGHQMGCNGAMVSSPHCDACDVSKPCVVEWELATSRKPFKLVLAWCQGVRVVDGRQVALQSHQVRHTTHGQKGKRYCCMLLTHDRTCDTRHLCCGSPGTVKVKMTRTIMYLLRISMLDHAWMHAMLYIQCACRLVLAGVWVISTMPT